METRQVQIERFLPIQVVATIAVIALLGVGAWQGYTTITKKGRVVNATGVLSSSSAIARTPMGAVNWQVPLYDSAPSSFAKASEDKDGISYIGDNVVGTLVGSYTTLSEAGTYTPEDGEQIASDIASSLRASVSYKTYTLSDLTTDTDTSHERMLTYRNDLRIALEPLLKNPGYELSLFANYIESRDTVYLEQLRQAAENYRAAVANAAAIAVPKDAATYHVGILNSLSEFGAVVERMTTHADDAFASAALLRTYNDSEASLVTSFNTLASYYKNKPL